MTMKRDIGLFLIDGCFDLLIQESDLVTDLGLETAIAISLFTDKRVPLQEIPEQEISQKGWWGDMFPVVQGDRIGSRLWIHRRLKRTNETRLAIIQAAKDSLGWLIEDGAAKAVAVDGEYLDDGALLLNVDVTRSNGPASRYSVVWDSQGVRRA